MPSFLDGGVKRLLHGAHTTKRGPGVLMSGRTAKTLPCAETTVTYTNLTSKKICGQFFCQLHLLAEINLQRDTTNLLSHADVKYEFFVLPKMQYVVFFITASAHLSA